MRRLIIDGNAVYEIDEKCMQKKKEKKQRETENEKLGTNQMQKEHYDSK